MSSADSASARKSSACRAARRPPRPDSRAARRRTRGSSPASRSARPVRRSEALLDQRLERVQVGVATCLGRLERAAAGEDREPAKSRCSSAASSSYDHSIVARSVCWRGSASRPPLSRSSRCRQPLEDLRRREHARPRGGELDASGRSSRRGRAPSTASSGSSRERARRRARPPRGRASGGTGYSTSPCDAQQLPARDEQAQVRAGAEQRGELGRGLDHLLEVVEHEQQLALADVRGEPVLRRRASARPSRRRAAGRGAAPSRTQNTPAVNSPDELGGRLDREPRLARAARAGQRDQPRAVRGRARPTSATSRSRPTNELAGRGRFVFEIVFSGGKSPSPSWKIEHRLVEVLQPCSPRSVSSSSTSSRVAAETSTCPPWPAAAIRAPRCTSAPT